MRNKKLNYTDSFLFKFSCCNSLEDFILINKLFKRNKKSHENFRKFYLSINREINKEKLELEYDTAKSIIHFADFWNELQHTKHLFDKIQFKPVMDGLKTELCIQLNNSVFSIDNKDLDYIFPPNFFGDRTALLKRRHYNECNHAEKVIIDPRFTYNFGKYHKISTNKPFFAVPISKENLITVVEHYKKPLELTNGFYKNYLLFKILFHCCGVGSKSLSNLVKP